MTAGNASIAALTDEQDMQKLWERTSALEGRVSSMKDDIAPLQRDLSYNVHLTAQHFACLDDLENRLRRNNIQAIGIPEWAEGKNSLTFIEKLLLSTFGEDAFSPMFLVERAHRVPERPPPPGANPHPFLFKLPNFKHRDTILSKACTMLGAMAIDNSKI